MYPFIASLPTTGSYQQNQPYRKAIHNEQSDSTLGGECQYSRDYQAVVSAVQVLVSAGVPSTILPALYKLECREPLQILLSASGNGLTRQQLVHVWQSLTLPTTDALSVSRPSSSLSGQFQQASSMRSYCSRLSGETLRSMNDPYGLPTQFNNQSIPETQEELQPETPLNWPEENPQYGISQTLAPGQNGINNSHVKLGQAFGYTTPLVSQTQDSSLTALLHGDPMVQDTFFLDDDNDAFDVPPHNAQAPGDSSMQLDQNILQAGLSPAHLATQGNSSLSPDRIPRAAPAQVHKFDYWTPSETKQPIWRSPCPMCDRSFVAQREFVAHMNAEHDHPIEFGCLHDIPSGRGAKRCPFRTLRSSRSVRHHTHEHRGCTKLKAEVTGPSTCVEEKPNPRPKKVWGCWLCPSAFTTVETWVAHHMRNHKCERKDVSYTWLMKSLLSQDALQSWWKSEVKKLEEKTQCTWNIQWYAGEDLTRNDLIKALETGYWMDVDFTRDTGACHALVAAAMKSTEKTRTVLEDFGTGSRHGPVGTPSPSLRQRSLRLPLRRSKSTLKQGHGRHERANE